MGNKHFLLYICILLCCVSCTKSNKKPIAKLDNETIRIVPFDEGMHNVLFSIRGKNLFSETFSGNRTYNVIKILNKYNSNYELAFMAMSNAKTGLPIDIKIDNASDTTIFFRFKPIQHKAHITTIKGLCAKLVSSSDDPQQKIDLKKWLFRRNAHIDNNKLNRMLDIINFLNSNGSTDYITNERIPVIKTFDGLSYKVTTDLKADYYILFATSSDAEVKNFVEEIVSNNFALASRSVNNSLNCYRALDNNGIKCIVLIGINEDWSYHFIPLGLVAIDNLPPSTNGNKSNNVKDLKFADNQRVILPKSRPQTDGLAEVFVKSWDGNGVTCNVTFSIYFEGDVKSVTIHRNSKLCYPGEHKVENKTINLSGKRNPYVFNYDMHFVGGDNIIPITIEDYHGNSKQTSITVPAEFVRSNTPDIDIDNNINIW